MKCFLEHSGKTPIRKRRAVMQENSRRGGVGKMAAPVERMAYEQNTPPLLQCAELVEFHSVGARSGSR